MVWLWASAAFPEGDVHKQSTVNVSSVTVHQPAVPETDNSTWPHRDNLIWPHLDRPEPFLRQPIRSIMAGCWRGKRSTARAFQVGPVLMITTPQSGASSEYQTQYRRTVGRCLGRHPGQRRRRERRLGWAVDLCDKGRLLTLSVGLSLDHELIGGVLESIDGALCADRVGHQSEPFAWFAVRGDDD